MPFGGTTSADDFQTGTIAAAFGGTTTLIDFAIQYKGQTLRQAFDTWMKKAHDKAVTDYAFHCIITDLGSAQLEEMGQLIREGVTSFKLFMAYPGVFMLDDATIFRAMRQAAKHNGLVCMHAENGGAIDVIVQQALAEGKRAPKYHALTRPTTAEAEATSRAIALAEMAGAPVYIVHLSCNEALEKVREARDRGLPAYAETCPQYLYLSLENMDAPGFEGAKYVFTPPLREKWHQEKLWQGLAKDTLQVVSTDHCPFCFKEQKELGKDDFTKIPNGGPGIEHRLSLVYTGGVHGLHRARKALRPLSAQRHHRRRLRRRSGHLRSPSRRSHQRENPSHARGLFHVRRHPDQRRGQNRLLPRPGGHRRRPIRRPPRRWPIPPPPNLRGLVAEIENVPSDDRAAHADRPTVEDAKAAIAASESRNHSFFKDREPQRQDRSHDQSGCRKLPYRHPCHALFVAAISGIVC